MLSTDETLFDQSLFDEDDQLHTLNQDSRERRLTRRRVVAILDQICNNGADYIHITELSSGVMSFPHTLQDDVELLSNYLDRRGGNVQFLNLSNIEFSYQSAVTMGFAISKSNLKSLEVRNLSFTKESNVPTERIAIAICDGIRTNKTIENYLAVFDCIEYQRLFYDELIGSMVSLRSIARRYMLDNTILSAIIDRNRSIVSIDISNDEFFRDDDVILLLVHIRDEIPIQKLFLGSNKIEHRGAEAVLERMCNHPTWWFVDLSNNTGIGWAGVKRLGDILQSRIQEGNAPLTKYLSVNLDSTALYYDENHGNGLDHRQKYYQNRCIKMIRHSLLKAVRDNNRVVGLYTRPESLGLFPQKDDPTNFYIFLNKNGRHLASTPTGMTPSMFSLVISILCRRPSQNFHSSAIFFFLQKAPPLQLCCTWRPNICSKRKISSII